MNKILVVIAGPTASGKTDLAIDLALHFRTEIISADSRQFYRELNIGTAKPTIDQLNRVKHHFINSLSVGQRYTAGMFEADCLALLEKLFDKNEVVIMCGGSGLYIRSVTDGFDPLPSSDPEIRNRLNQLTLAELQEQLKQLDPGYFQRSDIQNPQRLRRALEVCLITGKPYSELLQKASVSRPFSSLLFGIEWPRSVLYERINNRVDEMMRQGLVEEAQKFAPFRYEQALQTVGYSELFRFFDHEITLDQAIEQIKKNSRQYAKRQLTWFRKLKNMIWLKPPAFEPAVQVIENELNVNL